MDIEIKKNQGLTQAIASKLGLSKAECKKIDTTVWQDVMKTVDEEQATRKEKNPNDTSIFSGGNDVSTIDKKENWKSNFIAKEGTVSLSDESWSKISGMLGKKEAPKTEEKPKTEDKPKAEGKVIKRSVDGEKKDIIVTKNEKGQKVRRELNADGTAGDTLAATKTFGNNKYIAGDFPPETRIWERTVNGQKDTQIGVYHDDNGNKIRKLVVTDAKTGKKTLGEEIIPVKTFGKNKYITKTEFDAKVQADLDGKTLPEDVTAKISGDKITYKCNGKAISREAVLAKIK